MKYSVLTTVIIITLFITISSNAQVATDTTSPNASIQLDTSNTTKRTLPPRMTRTERDAIRNPALGLVIFNTTTNGLEFKSSKGWVSLTTSTDGSYSSVSIGTQNWMEKNLDVITYRNGDPIPYVTDPEIWASLKTGAWCYFNNDHIYGKLYNWYAVNDSRGLAPTGWHVPTDVEWKTLIKTLGGDSIAGGKMKVAGAISWTNPNTGVVKTLGFAGRPGGGRGYFGTFNLIGFGYWWSSTESGTTTAWNRSLSFKGSGVSRSSYDKTSGFSVRCLKD